jgi:hypothetical protein
MGEMPRDYKREYANYHSKRRQRQRRSARNQSRSAMVAAGRAEKGDGKDVHHKDHNPKNRSTRNLMVMSKSLNRSRKV